MNDPKNFQIVSVTIEPTNYPHGLSAELKILGVYPGATRADHFTVSPSAGCLWFHGLYYSKSVYISPADYAAMIDNATVKVRPDYLCWEGVTPTTSPDEISLAREDCKRSIEACNNRMKDAHPDYKPVTVAVEYLPPEVAANYYHPLQAPKPDESKITCFEQWIAAVDYRLRKRFGVGSNDLIDYAWRGLYDDDYTPRDAILAFVEDNADEFGLE